MSNIHFFYHMQWDVGKQGIRLIPVRAGLLLEQISKTEYNACYCHLAPEHGILERVTPLQVWSPVNILHMYDSDRFYVLDTETLVLETCCLCPNCQEIMVNKHCKSCGAEFMSVVEYKRRYSIRVERIDNDD